MLCVGSSLAVLVIGRIFQGLSAAIVGAVGLALLADTACPKHIGQVMGYVSLASNVAGLIAPLLGGVVYGIGGYYAVFAMCFGLVGVDIAFRSAMIEKKAAALWLDCPEISAGMMPSTTMAEVIDYDRGRNTSSGPVWSHNQAGVQCSSEAVLPLPEKQDYTRLEPSPSYRQSSLF